MLNKLILIILISIFLVGCSSYYDILEIEDVMNFENNEIIFTEKPKNGAETVVINELINKFGTNESGFENINVIDVRSYFTIEDLENDELDEYKITELEEIFDKENDQIIVYILYDRKLSNSKKINTLSNFYEGLEGQYFVLSDAGNDYEIVYGKFKDYIPVVVE